MKNDFSGKPVVRRRTHLLPLGLSILLVMEGPFGSIAQEPTMTPPPPPASTTPARDDISRQVAEDLAAFYQKPSRGPNPLFFAKAIAQLRDGDESSRAVAGKYLATLLTQTYADQVAGRAPSHSLPFWGGGVDNAAENLRKEIAGKLAESEGAEAGLEAAEWLINHDPRVENQALGFKFVCKTTPSPRSDAMIRLALATPHHNPEVLLAAIKEAAARKLAVAPEIARLCGWYRKAVREAARDVAGKWELPNIPPFRAAEAFSPWLEQQVKGFAAMVYPEIPKEAKWMRFTRTFEGSPKQEWSFSGWLMATKGEEVEVLDYFGEKQRIGAKSLNEMPRTFEEDAAYFAEARKPGKDPMDRARSGMRLSMRGGLTAQFEPSFISTPEALVAAWCFQEGKKELAASILFPRIDESPDDLKFVSAVRDLVGKVYHQQMLQAFCGNRDYDQALALARHLSKPVFDGYFYQPRAKELAAQIERRREDFKTFTLPTPTAWKSQKQGMSPKAQVEFLAAHLRLLNCFQWGQPGDVNYGDPQMAWARSNSAPDQKPEQVINPYEELRGMKMSSEELAWLVPFLTDQDFMLTFSYWRDFHPGRSLHRVSWAVARLVNDAAGRDLVDIQNFESLSAEEKQEVVSKALAWCKENSGKSQEQRLLESLASTKSQAEFDHIATKAVQQKSKAAAPVMTRRFEDFDWHLRGRILEYCYVLDNPEVTPFAREWLAKNPDTHPEMQLAEDESRFWATMIVLRASKENPPEGLKELGVLLNKPDDRESRYASSIDLLLSLKNEEANNIACGVLKNLRVDGFDFNAAEVLKRLILARQSEALAFLLKKLDSSTPAGMASVQGKSIQLVEGDGAMEIVREWKKGAEYDIQWPEERRREARNQMKAWLKEQFQLIKEGKPSAIPKQNPLFGSHAMVDAP